MTAAHAADKPHPRLDWLAHHPIQTAAALVATQLLATALFRFPLATPILDVATLGIYIPWLLAEHRHRRRGMCQRCPDDIPLDPAAAVTQSDRWLRAYHSNWPGIVTLLTAVIMAATVVIQVLSESPGTGLWVHLTAAAAYGVVLALAFVVNRHQTLYPWCPYCRRRRRWDDDGEPEPSPNPYGTSEALT